MKNYLVIDCGATTCKYAEIAENKDILIQKTKGFSPIVDGLEKFPEFKVDALKITDIYFFGTAVKDDNETLIYNFLKHKYPHCNIFVGSDLKAAAIACCGLESGYVHILGTGSAVNYWDGKKLTNPKINLGYLWEDYASGYDISKAIISYWNEDKLSKKEIANISEIYGDLRSFIQRVYEGNSKQLLADSSHAISKLSLKTQKNIINERLELYFTKNIDNFALQSIHHFVGSMALLFKKEINHKLATRGLENGKFLQDTMIDLIEFYKSKITNNARY